MPYLIDGHNLIPRLPGLSLEVIDDEVQLVKVLQEYCRRSRKLVEVYFDNAPPGAAQARNYGSVTARFVRAGTSADQAIQGKLQRLGRAARNWTVVSSDRQVQAAARASGARAIPAEAFAQQIVQTLKSQLPEAGETESLSPEALAEWMALFGIQGDDLT